VVSSKSEMPGSGPSEDAGAMHVHVAAIAALKREKAELLSRISDLESKLKVPTTCHFIHAAAAVSSVTDTCKGRLSQHVHDLDIANHHKDANFHDVLRRMLDRPFQK
jgi:hypothetical protein